MLDWKSINQRILLKEDKYTKFKNIKIFCGTYNVNGKSPDEFLAPWLLVDDSIDIYAIGFQEIVDLTTTSLLLRSDWAEKEEKWTNYVKDELFNKKNFKSNPNYKLVLTRRMFGLYLMVFASQKLCENAISEIFSTEIATGILTVGNKGSVAISLKINETRICFVCSHFAADTDKLEKRNADFRTTCQYLKFQSEQQDQNSNNYIDLDQHDIIFWFGDLNYRIDSISLNETLKMINSSSFNELVKYDQLSNERKKSRVFEFYEEGELGFRPTYKYLVKSDIYEKQAMIQQQQPNINFNDENSFDNIENQIGKVKLPSWTDRVLYKSSNLKVNLLKYICINTLTISDHKPVCALFETQIKKIDHKKLNELIQNEMKESDRKFNEEMPHIALEKVDFKFEDCTFYDRKSLHMVIKNEGMTKSNVDIIFHDSIKKDRYDDESDPNSNSSMLVHRQVAKSHELSQWVNIFPQHKERIEPGASFVAEITTCFNPRILPRFNKERLIEDFLIVRCLNGNDKFATISCNYKPTIMGVSLRALTTLDESFEKCDQKNLIHVVEHEIDEFEKNLNILFSLNLKNFTTIVQRENAARFMMNNSSDFVKPQLVSNSNTKTKMSSSVSIEHIPTMPQSMLQVYKRSFEHLREDIIDRDKYFNNDLSTEYTYLMEYLINRCKSNLNSLLDENEQNTRATETNTQTNTLTIEEQKNLALYYLSSKNFTDFEKANFESELLAEILNDLLISLPQPLIPSRYLDFCSYTNNCYEEASNLLFYLPKSHLKLFEMIVKFLQIYLKCLTSCDTNFHNILADAIFQINFNNNSGRNDIINVKNKTTVGFLKLFLDHHTKFKYIE